MPQDYMLDKGVTESGMASRSYDKYGKRRWVATPKEAGPVGSHDIARKVPTDRKAGSPKGVDSNTVRTDVGI